MSMTVCSSVTGNTSAIAIGAVPLRLCPLVLEGFPTPLASIIVGGYDSEAWRHVRAGEA